MLPDDQLVDLRQMVGLIRDRRCAQVDADGCRCLVRQDQHPGPCDFSYTPFLPLVPWRVRSRFIVRNEVSS